MRGVGLERTRLVRIVSQGARSIPARQADECGRRALAETAQVLAEACLDRTIWAAVQMLDEPAHEAEPILERQPWVPFPDPCARLRPDVGG